MDGYQQVHEAFDGADEIFPVDCEPPSQSADPRTPQAGVPVDPEADPSELLAMECATLPLNDYGNGKRFTAYFGSDVLFVPRVGWFVWDGRMWAQDDDTLEVRRLAQKISGKITGEAAFIRLEDWEVAQMDAGELAQEAADAIREIAASKRSDSQKSQLKDFEAQAERAAALKKKLAGMRRGHHSHAKAAGNTGPINNAMGEAKVDVYRPLADLNKNKVMLNTENCVLIFREALSDVTGKKIYKLETQPHSRHLLLTKMMACEYLPEAKCPEFINFIETILPSPEIREFIQRWFGYSLTGLTTEQKLAFLYGGGRNGKSTLVELIGRMMGAYSVTVPIESLAGSEQRKGSDATPDLVRLPGARMVHASEPERGQKMREALIKQLTGGGEMLVRRMMQEFVEVTPEFSLTIEGNYKPEIRGTDNGIWRRVLLIPFLTQISDEDADALLPEKLWAERAGIFNWLLDGCRKWLETGLMIPQEVLDATKEYREESDPMLGFINECCDVDGCVKGGINVGTFTRASDLNEAFNWWYSNAGRGDPWKPRTIFQHLKDKTVFFATKDGQSFTHHKSNGNTGWKGIALKVEFVQQRADAEADARYQGGPDIL